MDSENYKEGQSMQRPPLFEANCFIYWKNRFETYVKSKDIDLWYIIVHGNYKPTIKDKDGKDVVITYDKFDENQKKMISKNDEAKMVLYNALPKKEYERIFMCNTEQDIWNSLIITHQDCAFSKFNTIITSLKALDESFISRNHVRKFLRALPTKWRPKVTEIEESKDLSTLSLDELIGNLKVYEVVLEKDLEVSRNKKEKYKSLAIKARQVLSEDDASSSDSNDEEYAMTVRDFKKFFRRRGKFVRQPYDDKKNFREAKEDKKENEYRRCFNGDDSKKEGYVHGPILIEVRLKVNLEPDEWIKDSGCTKHMTGNKDLFSSYKAMDGDTVMSDYRIPYPPARRSEYPPSPKFVPEHVIQEFMPPEDEVFPAEDQPLLAARRRRPLKDKQIMRGGDKEEDSTYPHADSTDVAFLAVDHVPSAEETGPFETNESAATPPPQKTLIPISFTEVRALRTTVLAQQTEIAALRVANRARQAQLIETLRLISTLQIQKMAPKRTTRANPVDTTTTTSVTNAQLKATIDQGVTDALAARDADRNTNGDDGHNSGTWCLEGHHSLKRNVHLPRLSVVAQPLNFKGIGKSGRIDQWFEKIETVFSISNCSMENQIKFSTCTLLAGAVTWWNSHVRTIGHDVAYAMTWIDLKKKMTDKMFPEESDKIKRYVGGLPDMIYGSVIASKPKTMQEAIEIATELMDKKIHTFAERQTEKKRKQDDNQNN
ncbi:hypothetical protein Tco_0794783 [Tanacetum coccineum]